MQGWKEIPWLISQTLESWKINKDWTIINLDKDNIDQYAPDVDYINSTDKNISVQAKSDIIRLSVLKNNGGIWADATMLCMQPLNHWIFEAVRPSGFWMYHGCGAGMPRETGPASWFIASEKDNYIISRWKDECDRYWSERNHASQYFWMDHLFRDIHERDEKFRTMWSNCPYLYCESEGQSHCLFTHKMEDNNPKLKEIFRNSPPYVLKFWRHWENIFPDTESDDCKNSNGYFAIEMSKRSFEYKHNMIGD